MSEWQWLVTVRVAQWAHCSRKTSGITPDFVWGILEKALDRNPERASSPVLVHR